MEVIFMDLNQYQKQYDQELAERDSLEEQALNDLEYYLGQIKGADLMILDGSDYPLLFNTSNPDSMDDLKDYLKGRVNNSVIVDVLSSQDWDWLEDKLNESDPIANQYKVVSDANEFGQAWIKYNEAN